MCSLTCLVVRKVRRSPGGQGRFEVDFGMFSVAGRKEQTVKSAFQTKPANAVVFLDEVRRIVSLKDK